MQPETFKEDTLTGAEMTTQEDTFKIQLGRDRKMQLTWPEKSVLLHK